ncbi:MAG TPA: aquaporin [Candidatus Saccharimonadales bacterium]|nr:aquaporin [Candidatus Saccharimonadales bacterium]
MYDLWKALITEFLGTFILVFVGAGAVALNVANGGSVLGNALAFGLTYMFLIYTLSNYSGANFNPAISFGMAVAGRLGWCRMLLYWLVQFAAAFAAAGLIMWIFGVQFGAGAPVGQLSIQEPWKVVVIEMILSFFLIFTFLVVTKNPLLSSMSGLIIGLTLSALILFGGFLAKVGLNPAYALATEVFAGNAQAFWIVVLGNILGALIAVLFYKLLVSYPWSCEEIESRGCMGDCGMEPFHVEHMDCTESFMLKGQRQFEKNKMELEAMGEDGACFTPCHMPEPCPKVCEPKICEPKCSVRGRRRYL